MSKSLVGHRSIPLAASACAALCWGWSSLACGVVGQSTDTTTDVSSGSDADAGTNSESDGDTGVEPSSEESSSSHSDSEGTASDATDSEDGGSICGNGVVEEGESCDDGNDIVSDGCNPDCELSGSLVDEFAIEVGENLPTAMVVDPAATSVIVASGNYGDPVTGFLSSFDTQGNRNWALQRDNAVIDPVVGRLSTDAEGNIYLIEIVFVEGADPERSARLHKIAPDGRSLWEQDLPGLAGTTARGGGASPGGQYTTTCLELAPETNLPQLRVLSHDAEGRLVYDFVLDDAGVATQINLSDTALDGSLFATQSSGTEIPRLLVVSPEGEHDWRELPLRRIFAGRQVWYRVRGDMAGDPWVMRTIGDSSKPLEGFTAELVHVVDDELSAVTLESSAEVTRFAAIEGGRIVVVGRSAVPDEDGAPLVRPWVGMFNADGSRLWQQELGDQDHPGSALDLDLGPDGELYVLYGQDRGANSAWVARLRP